MPDESLIESKGLVNADGERVTDGAAAANYRYWQQNGADWPEEYDRRKREQIRYHIQEWMIADYVRRLAEGKPGAPLTVFEYGCGVGRHLANLVKLPNVKAFGFDQSAEMIKGCLRWTGQDWLDEHVTVGEPTGTLPFEDGTFDLVFTSEVLVHVRPEDLPGRLGELVRIASGHVLNIEPAPHYEIVPHAHFGCWNHDIVSAYDALGLRCELLPAGFFSQTPYRVDLDGEAPEPAWCPVSLALMRRMEEDINAGREEHIRKGRRQGEDAAMKRADQRIAEIQTRLHNERNAAAAVRNERDQLHRELTDGKLELELLKRKRQDLEDDRRRSGERIERLTAAVADKETRIAELCADTSALDAVRAEADGLRAEIAALRAEVETERAGAAERIAQAEAQLAETKKRLAQQLDIGRRSVLEVEHRRQDDRALVAKLAARQELFINRVNEILGDTP